MALTTTPYCTPQDVRSLLDLTSTQKDPLILSLIEDAQDVIDNILGYSFQSETATRTFDGNDLDFLVVGDILSFTQVLENGVDITLECKIGPYNQTPGWKIIRIAQAIVGLPILATNADSPSFEPGRANITVTGVWGRTTIPNWCNRVTSRLAAHWFQLMNTNYADYVSEQGGIKQKYNKAIPDDVKEILNYKARHIFGSRS